MSLEKNERRFKERMVDICGIPKETVLGCSIISIVGNNEMLIENHRGILEYYSEQIRILTKLGQIKITGKELTIHQYTNGEIKIMGKMKDVEFI